MLLMVQYNAMSIIPVDRVVKDYFSHLTTDSFIRKASSGDIKIPLVRIDAGSQKCAKGVHLSDLGNYIDLRRAAAVKEANQLAGVT